MALEEWPQDRVCKAYPWRARRCRQGVPERLSQRVGRVTYVNGKPIEGGGGEGGGGEGGGGEGGGGEGGGGEGGGGEGGGGEGGLAEQLDLRARLHRSVELGFLSADTSHSAASSTSRDCDVELDCKQLSSSKPSQAAAAASQAAAIVNQKLVTHLFAALEKLAIAQQSIADTANSSAIESELLSSLPLPEHLRWLVTSEALLQANLAALTRPALLALLKEAGVSALPDRQLVANIVSKAKRERADSEQTTAAELSSTQPQPQRAMVIPSLLTFRIVGSKMESLRLALLRRGWHEQGEEAASSSSSTPPLALKWTRKASECGFNLATADLLINHFPNAQELVTKHGLNRNLRALSRLDQVDTTLVSPPTFYAGDATQLRELIALAEKEEEEGSVWIVKEEGGRRGVGISILDQLHDVLTRCDDLHYRVVVQRYIPNPLLIRSASLTYVCGVW